MGSRGGRRGWRCSTFTRRDAGRIVVTSPKTEHHPGKATRTIPLFPELRTALGEPERPDQGEYVSLVWEVLIALDQKVSATSYLVFYLRTIESCAHCPSY